MAPRALMIHGLGGNDTIDGQGGKDVICGDNSDDVLTGATDFSAVEETILYEEAPATTGSTVEGHRHP